jgi:hypothetical protein|tara:strand:- start:3430 stop:4071 length:642 start_codon:yes stop_codon:yes gene_type:complete
MGVFEHYQERFDATEVAAHPVHVMCVLEQQIEQEQYPQKVRDRYVGFIKEYLAPNYVEFIGKEIQTAYLKPYSEYGQNIFDRYVTYADFWIQDREFRDPETGDILDRVSLNEELEKIEKLDRRIPRVPFIDDNDLRHNLHLKRPVPTSQAVMFCLMDVSGSLDQSIKDIAKRFYLLLYMFLKHLHRLWGFPVSIDSVWEEKAVATNCCPPDAA